MGRTEHPHGSTGSVPTDLPQTTPQVYPLSDHSFSLQTIMEMQKTLGQLIQAVSTLTEESKKNSTKLDDVSHKIYGAKVAFGVAIAILGALGSVVMVLFWKLWDTIGPVIQIKPHP